MSFFRPVWRYMAHRLQKYGEMIGPKDRQKLEGRFHKLEKFRLKQEKRNTDWKPKREAAETLDDIAYRMEKFRRSIAKDNFKVDSNPDLKGDLDSLAEALREKTLELKEKIRPVEDSGRMVAKAKAGSSAQVEALNSARALRHENRPAEAIRLLESFAPLAENPAEIRVVQAAIAYEKSWDADVIDFLREAVRTADCRRDTLIWGPIAIISNAHWSRAMNGAEMKSKTFVWGHAAINKREDFDVYVEDIIPEWAGPNLKEEFGVLQNFLAFLHVIENASAVHIPMTGSFLGYLRIWREEAALFHEAGIKIVVLPFGGDYHCYSRIKDPAVRHGLLVNYPELARQEETTQARVTYWQREADCVLAGFMVDAMGRWDVTTFNFFHIDTEMWSPRKDFGENDGRNGPVRVIHTPNHRGFKGTEFLIDAVEKLKAKGLQVDLVLLEKRPNEEVRRLMQECDILAEQFVAVGYAFSGLEGMASGLAVMCNLEDEYYTRVFRRNSFLNECPILSTTPETLERNLEILVTRPDLRAELGRAGRIFVEKYHSHEAARYLFGKIYERILEDKEVDLLNLFHPLLSESAETQPPVEHPLVESRLPDDSPFLKE